MVSETDGNWEKIGRELTARRAGRVASRLSLLVVDHLLLRRNVLRVHVRDRQRGLLPPSAETGE